MKKEDLKNRIIEAIEYKNINLNDIDDSNSLAYELDYDGALHEIIDSNIDIYYYSLRQWAVDNWEHVEDAINEGLVDTDDFDYHKAIQGGQYVLGQQLAFEAIEEIFEESKELETV